MESASNKWRKWENNDTKITHFPIFTPIPIVILVSKNTWNNLFFENEQSSYLKLQARDKNKLRV